MSGARAPFRPARRIAPPATGSGQPAPGAAVPAIVYYDDPSTLPAGPGGRDSPVPAPSRRDACAGRASKPGASPFVRWRELPTAGFDSADLAELLAGAHAGATARAVRLELAAGGVHRRFEWRRRSLVHVPGPGLVLVPMIVVGVHRRDLPCEHPLGSVQCTRPGPTSSLRPARAAPCRATRPQQAAARRRAKTWGSASSKLST